MPPELKPIDPKVPRWEPSTDPNDIVVPGLDTAAPPYDQIEQIEQLITIKLQNIDANFSKIQNVMANRILPAVKKYAVGTQPVREAAKFWTTFYEQAAQIRIPTYDDYGTGQEEQDETEITQMESEATPSESSSHTDPVPESVTPPAHRTFDPDRTPSEVSFAPGQGAMSTPATVGRARAMNVHDSFTSQGSEPVPSWSVSLESPMRQLNRDIQSLSEDRSAIVAPNTSTRRPEPEDASADITQRPISSKSEHSVSRTVDKGKSREGPQPLLHNVLRKNANSSTVTASPSRTTSPLKIKAKTPLKTLNPYLPPDSKPSDWKGVVDLKDPSVASPQRTITRSAVKLPTFKPSAVGPSRTRTKTPPPIEDDSFDFGMSPPVMTDYARLPTLGRTPRKEAAERIMKSLVDVEQRGVFGPTGAAQRAAGPSNGKGHGTTGYGTESSMSSMPSPPSMARYSRRTSYAPGAMPASETSGSVTDVSLDSMMRRVGLNVSSYTSKQAAPPPAPVVAPSVFQAPPPVFSALPSSLSLGSMRSAASSVFQPPPAPAPAPPPPPPPRQPTPEPIITPQPHFNLYDGDEVIGRHARDADDSMDSMDSLDDEAAPPFEFEPQEDDSFDSIDDDSLDSDMGAGAFMVAPPDDDDGFDDSFDDEGYGDGEEETVFGVPPAERLRQQAQAAHLRMLGEDLLQDTIGIGAQMAMAGRVEESPTPWNNARG